MKIGFAGTPDFAVPSLQALIASQHDVVAVWTQPDRPAGRGKRLQASAVKQVALEHQLPVHQPLSLRAADAQQVMADYQLDALVVAAYGLLLPKAVLDLPQYGCINVHASLLPRWRGAAPIQAAILAGDAETGVTIMQMDVGLDTGDMLAKTSVAITSTTTAGVLTEQLADSGAVALVAAMDDLPQLQRQAESQQEALSTHAGKIAKQDACIDWQLSSIEIDRRVRAYHPWPVAFTELNGERLRVWSGHVTDRGADGVEPGTVLAAEASGLVVATGQGAYAITEMQLPGKRRMPVQDFLNACQALKQAARCRLG